MGEALIRFALAHLFRGFPSECRGELYKAICREAKNEVSKELTVCLPSFKWVTLPGQQASEISNQLSYKSQRSNKKRVKKK